MISTTMPDIVQIRMSDEDADNQEIWFTKKGFAKLVECKINGGISTIDVFGQHLAIISNTTVIHGRLTWVIHGRLTWNPSNHNVAKSLIRVRLGLNELFPWNIV